jgi:malate dehydrogenase (oxaloacetate-decarboxylating)
MMPSHNIDTIFRIRLSHRPGELARLAAAIAEQGALLGEITTVRVGEGDTVRDITIETSDDAHTRRLIETVQRLEGIELLHTLDRVFECHRGGKLHSTSRVEVRQVGDLRHVYTPGVARVALAIEADPERAWELTGIGNSVGIFTNGSRVLGLGGIGALASLPVMEGKAVLYDRFAGVSATPILVDTLDPADFVETVVRIAPSFGAIHLEDVRTPDCFFIEDQLRARLAKPVLHDDQHGTATAALAAIINACRLTGLDLRRARLGQVGLGAAGSAIATLAHRFGVEEVLVSDVSADATARLTARGARATDLARLMREADIVIATTGRPGLIEPSMVRAGQVIFALSNPEPEIAPDEARAAGAAFAGDGRSINNALAFPGLFKGALEVRSRAITIEMLIAAAEAIADLAEPGEVVPGPLNPEVHLAVRRASARCAQQLGLENTARAK